MTQSCLTLIRAFEAHMNTHLPPSNLTFLLRPPVVYTGLKCPLLCLANSRQSVCAYVCLSVCVQSTALRLWPGSEADNQQGCVWRMEITAGQWRQQIEWSHDRRYWINTLTEKCIHGRNDVHGRVSNYIKNKNRLRNLKNCSNKKKCSRDSSFQRAGAHVCSAVNENKTLPAAASH